MTSHTTPADPAAPAAYAVLPAELATTGHVLTDPGNPADARPDAVPVVTDPRTLDLTELTERHDLAPHKLLLGQGAPLRLVRLAPRGPVSHPAEYPHELHCPHGWTVTEVLPDLHPVFGPQAAHLTALVATAERVLIHDPDSPASDAYISAVSAQYQDGRWSGALHAEAARAALDTTGADGWWWDQIGACVYGAEVLALAARDLIGAHPGWTTTAYQHLTHPWRTTIDPPHPNDDPASTGQPASTRPANLSDLPGGVPC